MLDAPSEEPGPTGVVDEPVEAGGANEMAPESEGVMPIVVRDAPPRPIPTAAEDPSGTSGQAADAAPAAADKPTTPARPGVMDAAAEEEMLRRVNRSRQVVSLVSQLIIRAYDEQALHAETCRFLVTFGGYLMAWVGRAEEKPARIIRPVAHAGLKSTYLETLRLTWTDDLTNDSTTSRAIQEQRPQVARYIPTDASMQWLRQDAKLHGYMAMCAIPLQFGSHGMGVLTIHAAEPHAFGPEEVSLLRELASDLSAGVIGLREKAKRQLLEKRLAAVVDAAEDAIIGKDVRGAVLEWNQGATKLFGYSRQEVLGRSISEFLVPAEQQEEYARIMETITRGERVPRFESSRLCKDGRLVHTSIMLSPMFAGNGEFVGSTSIEHDITEARMAADAQHVKQLEEAEVLRLKALETVRSVFISEASHELNTPLTPLRIHVEALSESKTLGPQERDHLIVIERNVLRLCNLVKDMLEASRLETGRFKLEVADTPLAVLVGEAIQNVSELATKAGVTLESEPAAPLVVGADRNRVGQVLYNLLSNAIGFTPKGGRVTVSAKSEGGQAVVRVTDTGIGLSADQIGRLFQPFSRPHEGLGSGPRGTGLGLFISKGIIEQHGGHIWAESKGPGAGASFCFSLPLVQAPRRPIAFVKETAVVNREMAEPRSGDHELDEAVESGG